MGLESSNQVTSARCLWQHLSRFLRITFPVCTAPHVCTSWVCKVEAGCGLPWGTWFLVLKCNTKDIFFVCLKQHIFVSTVWCWSRPLEKQVCFLCNSSSTPSHPSHMLFLSNSHLLDAIRFGRILAWGSEIWNYVGCDVWPFSPCLSSFTFCGNMDAHGNVGFDVFLWWVESVGPHWYW